MKHIHPLGEFRTIKTKQPSLHYKAIKIKQGNNQELTDKTEYFSPQYRKLWLILHYEQ
ncbi:hypothetical protein [Erwinia psidii]|uniref:hypothetical protein n=1 Tax=Erwinia psidii TaxID=69224 RepID=UPI00226B3A3B|nr:hypothetical protein [Erwinia psidii]